MADDRGDDGRDDVRAALAEIRREGRKATLLPASVEGVCVFLALNLVLGVVDVPVVDRAFAAGAVSGIGVPAPTVGTLVALAGGLGGFVAAVRLRTRRPIEERFEAANPEIRETLRTARDTAAADRSNPMARALYADVLDRLKETSSVGLVDTTRLVAAVVLAFVLSAATVQTAVVGIDLGGTKPTAAVDVGGSGTGSDGFTDRSSVDLRDGDEVLGEPTDVTAGSENLSAEVGGGPGGEGDEEWTYDRDAGSDGDGTIEAERSGFASPERVEDAALVRRYVRELEEDENE